MKAQFKISLELPPGATPVEAREFLITAICRWRATPGASLLNPADHTKQVISKGPGGPMANLNLDTLIVQILPREAL